MKTMLKVSGFIALMGIYFHFAGPPGWHTLFGRKLAVIYGMGAVMTLWLGGQRIGSIDPISLRPIFIILGVLLMIAMLILMLATRDTASQLLELHGCAPKHSTEEASAKFLCLAALRNI